MKLIRVLTGYYKLVCCTRCHGYSRKGELDKGKCPHCGGKVEKA